MFYKSFGESYVITSPIFLQMVLITYSPAVFTVEVFRSTRVTNCESVFVGNGVYAIAYSGELICPIAMKYHNKRCLFG